MIRARVIPNAGTEPLVIEQTNQRIASPSQEECGWCVTVMVPSVADVFCDSNFEFATWNLRETLKNSGKA